MDIDKIESVSSIIQNVWQTTQQVRRKIIMNLYNEEQKRENEIETEKWAQEKQIDEDRQIGEDDEETKEWEDEKKKDLDE